MFKIVRPKPLMLDGHDVWTSNFILHRFQKRRREKFELLGNPINKPPNPVTRSSSIIKNLASMHSRIQKLKLWRGKPFQAKAPSFPCKALEMFSSLPRKQPLLSSHRPSCSPIYHQGFYSLTPPSFKLPCILVTLVVHEKQESTPSASKSPPTSLSGPRLSLVFLVILETFKNKDNLDIMHIGKNVCDNILSSLL